MIVTVMIATFMAGMMAGIAVVSHALRQREAVLAGFVICGIFLVTAIWIARNML